MLRKGQPIIVLTCQHDSHYFEERTIVVNEVIKVGRAVARSKASPTNAIFDCKVLSRNHAVIWFTSDEFWLRDTNSSNGTFVNNTRVSKKDESESCDRQIFSGDVIRFGVDVVEHDTTHGCIIASVTLILPNGQEARPSLGHMGETLPSGLISITNEQMFQISSFLNDTLFREQTLNNKLEILRRDLQQATQASELGWQAMINEEKLLQKLDLYENQMRLFKEDLPENSLKLRLSELLEEKNLQEVEWKNQLVEILAEKETAVQRIKDLERTVDDLRNECAHLRDEYTSAQNACNNISDEHKAHLSTISQRLNEITAERNQSVDQLALVNQKNSALQEQYERISRELVSTKEMYEKIKFQDSTSWSELVLEANQPKTNAYISNSIRDFNHALQLIRLLGDKVSASVPSTDLDFSVEEVIVEKPRETVAGMLNNDDPNDVSSLSSTSLECLVARIVRYNESAMKNLHAYFQQVSPPAVAELFNTIHHNSLSAVDGEEKNHKDTKFIRPNFLTLNDFADKSVETMNSASADEGVTVAGADSLSTSPIVTSGSGILTTISPDAEEVTHLRECVRLANEEIEQYKRHIVELQTAAVSEKVSIGQECRGNIEVSTRDRDLEEMRAECCILRARIGDIEEQVEQTRDRHRHLVDEIHQHRSEVEKLRNERTELETALAESQAQISRLKVDERLQSVTSTDHLLAAGPWRDNLTVSTDQIELATGRLVTAPFLTVIPLMLLLFAIMFAIFYKFVS